LAGGIINMQVPADEPAIQVFARIQGAAELPHVPVGWEKALAEEADGYAVSVWVRSTTK
jgi:hypothetical protein